MPPTGPRPLCAATAPPSRKSADSRHHRRILVNLPIRCTETGGGRLARSWRGRTADVGGGGFAVEIPTRFARGTVLTIEVRTGIGPMRLETEVLWTRKSAGGAETVRHGLRLAEGSEILDLPIGVLLGEWLRRRAAREEKSTGRRAGGPRRGRHGPAPA